MAWWCEQHKLSDEKVEEYTRYYYAMITFIDQEIGKIREELEKKGELDNTIIILQVITESIWEIMDFYKRDHLCMIT